VKVLVCDPIAEEALETLRSRPGLSVVVCSRPPAEEELIGLIGDAEVVIVRSATRIGAAALAAAGRLRVIGRAGSGVDNVDLEEATRRGVLVVNAPAANSVAAAEHSFSLLSALARNIPQAGRSLRAGRWERGKYMGVELAGKTLGILGLGRVGREVARRAVSFRMQVLAYDPYVPSLVARDIGTEPAVLDDLLSRSEFLTLHLPLTEETRGIIDERAIALMRAGVRIVNCARGELIDEAALLRGIESGKIAGAALDVFCEEPPRREVTLRLIERDEVIATPHLGASTVEAQRRVGEEIVAKILGFLNSGIPADAVNFPAIPPQQAERLAPFMRLAESLGAFLSQIGPQGMRRLELRFSGELASLELRPLTMAAARGVLSPVLESPVGYVNALSLAGERGLAVEEIVSHEPVPYSSLIELRLWGEKGEEASCSGTVFRPGDARIVSIDGIGIEAALSGVCVFFRNNDIPGVVGAIGTILGRNGVNIAAMGLGRHPASGTALAIVNVDSPIPPSVMDEIRAQPEVRAVRQVRL